MTVFYRGNAEPNLPDSVRCITRDRNDSAARRIEIERLAPDVVVDFLLSDDRQALAQWIPSEA